MSPSTHSTSPEGRQPKAERQGGDPFVSTGMTRC